jgi:hypothetical protein
MIFISYAREDQSVVADEVYLPLKEMGYDPWMDTADIVGGEDWGHAIERAIAKADFFLACLSARSIRKRGILQTEIQRAIEKWKEKLPDDIYLVPLRLEPCELPDRLSPFQAIDFFLSDGRDRLRQALDLGIARLGKAHSPSQANSLAYSIARQSYEAAAEGDPPFVVEIHYPKIAPQDAPWAIEINGRIAGWIAEYRQEMGRFQLPWIAIKVPRNRLSGLKSQLLIDYKVALYRERLFSVEFTVWTYGAGAAHGNTAFRTFNFWLEPVGLIQLGDLFVEGSNYLDRLSQLSREELRGKRGAQEWPEDGWIEKGTTATHENFNCFSITETGLRILIAPYQVGPFAWGSHEIPIAYAQIRDILRPDGPLQLVL